jgi:hypothetical protein
MQNSNLYFTLFQKISGYLTILLNIQAKKKTGRPPKVSDLQLAALYITPYISNTPINEIVPKLFFNKINHTKSKKWNVYMRKTGISLKKIF